MFSINGTNNCITKKTALPCAQKEVVSEISLPDYLPDVSRLLRTSATVGNVNDYVNGQSLEYDGDINYVIVYATSDGRIKSIPLSAEFDGSIALPDLEGDYQTQINADIESVTCRLQNPRRFTVKTKLCVSADIYSEACVEPQITGQTADGDGFIRKKVKTVDSMRVISVKDENVPISEDVEIGSDDPPIGEIVSVTLAPFISDAHASNGVISYRGDVAADVIYLAASDGDGQAEYRFFTRKIPIYGEVAAEGVSSDCSATGGATVSGVEFRPQANALGENRTVEIDFTYTVTLFAACNAPASIVEDMYSTARQSASETAETKVRRALKAGSFNFTSDGSAPLDDKEHTKVVSSSASATVSGVEKNGSKATFVGETDVSVILTDGAGSYVGRTFSVPFKAETEVGRSAGELDHFADASVISTSVRVDGGEMKCDAEIGIAFFVSDVSSEQTVAKCVITQDRPQVKVPASNIVICYPAEGETLWDIAKRYGISEEAIKQSNPSLGEISSDSVIIIPGENKKKLPL
ncbi:MAG: DUF3794 domain-containing protein [Clostridia bacterium]|nr:DUF3794 domain-containing protein [Clostridia bacterium]